MKKILIAMVCLMLLLFAAAADTPEIHTEIDCVDLVKNQDTHRFELYELIGTVSKARPAKIHISNMESPWQVLFIPNDYPTCTLWIVCNLPEGHADIQKGDRVHFIGSYQSAADISDGKGNIVQIPFFIAGTFEITE